MAHPEEEKRKIGGAHVARLPKILPAGKVKAFKVRKYSCEIEIITMRDVCLQDS
jgi:hypothetical protein